MKIQKAILSETRHIALGVLLADIVMCVIFALFQHFDVTVVLGALWGSVFSVGNFFFMGLSVQKAMDLEESVKIYMHKNYALRMLFCVAGMAIGLLSPWFHNIAVLIPFLMPKIVIYAMRLFGFYRPDKSAEAERGENTE